MVVMPSGYYYFGGYDMNAKELTVLMVDDLYCLRFLKPKQVGNWSAEGEMDILSTDDMDFKTGLMRNLQVPPRAPKEKDIRKDVLFLLAAAHIGYL